MEKIYQWPLDYGETFQIKSDFDLEESISHLQKVTRKKSWCTSLIWAVSQNENSDFELVGTVSKDKIRLARARRYRNDPSKPLFNGTFIQNGATAILEGSFVVGCWQKFVFWLAVAVWTVMIISVLYPLSSSQGLIDNLQFLSFIPGLWFLRAGISYVFKNNYSSDIDWMLETVTQTLKTPETR